MVCTADGGGLRPSRASVDSSAIPPTTVATGQDGKRDRRTGHQEFTGGSDRSNLDGRNGGRPSVHVQHTISSVGVRAVPVTTRGPLKIREVTGQSEIFWPGVLSFDTVMTGGRDGR